MKGRKKGFNHDEDTRKKIQAKQLINRLTNCALGYEEMNNQQVKAATALLNKVLPDMQSIDGQIDHSVFNTVSPEPVTTSEWEKKYGESKTTH